MKIATKVYFISGGLAEGDKRKAYYPNVSRFPSVSSILNKVIKLIPSSKVPKKGLLTVAPKQMEKNVTCRYCGYDGEGYSSHQVFGCRC